MKYMRRDCRSKTLVSESPASTSDVPTVDSFCFQAHTPLRRYTCPEAFFTILLTSLILKADYCRCEFNVAKQIMARDVEGMVVSYFPCISFSTFRLLTPWSRVLLEKQTG
jgi:hypothetical protein